MFPTMNIKTNVFDEINVISFLFKNTKILIIIEVKCNI